MIKKNFRFFLVISIVILAIVAVFVNAALRRNLNDSERIDTSLLRLQGLAYHLSALEWQSISMGQMSSEVVETVQTTRDEMQSILGELEQLDPNSEDLSKVRQAFTTYDSAIVEEFRLIMAGDLEQAHSLDKEQVDPSFNVLAEELTSAGASYNAKTAQVKRGSDLGFTILLLFISAATAWTFWQFQKVQAASERKYLDELKTVNLELEANQKRLEQRVADRTKALATSTEVSRRLSTILNQKQLFTEVVDQVKNAFGYYHTQIYFYDEAKENLVMAGGTGEAGATMLASGHKLAKGQGLVGRAAESNEPILVSDTTQDSNWLPNPLLPDTKSEAAIPIAIGNEVLGVLDVQHNIADGLQQDDVNSLQSIANQVAVAVGNARSYDKVREAEQLTRNVIDSTDDWIFIKDQNHRYQLVNQGYANSLHIPIADFIGKNDLELGFPEELVKGNPEKGLPGFWADDRSVMDGGVSKQIPDDLVTIDGNIRVFDTVKVPLRNADNKVWGVLAFARDMTERRNLEELNRKRASQQQALNLITQRIQNTTSVEAALQIAARELGHALGMKSTLVTLDPSALAQERKG